MCLAIRPLSTFATKFAVCAMGQTVQKPPHLVPFDFLFFNIIFVTAMKTLCHTSFSYMLLIGGLISPRPYSSKNLRSFTGTKLSSIAYLSVINSIASSTSLCKV